MTPKNPEEKDVMTLHHEYGKQRPEERRSLTDIMLTWIAPHEQLPQKVEEAVEGVETEQAEGL